MENNMEVFVFDDRKAMGDAAGKKVADKILKLLGQQEEVRMIFAAAPSQKDFFTCLRQASDIPWNRITAFHMDEYIGLPPHAPQLFSNFLKKHLFDHVNFKAVHLMDGNRDHREESRRYAALLSENPIDIVCLGIGENGHIAFNDPPVADFNDPEIIKVVELDQASRQQQVNDGCFPSMDQVPRQALTLTIPSLVQGKFLYCMVPGARKREAVRKTLYGPVTTACPASVLQRHTHCKIYLDTGSYGDNHTLKNFATSEVSAVEGINCISGETQKIAFQNGKIEKVEALQDKENITPQDPEEKLLPFIGPGLIDLQVNGFNGIDFNDAALSREDVLAATQYLLQKGVTTYFPAIITNSDESVLHIVRTIQTACESYPLVNSCIGGIHLEGPFISKSDGPRGAHHKKYVKHPDWDLINRFQEAAGGRIKLITMAPEWKNSSDFIRKCREHGILVGIGHSDATAEEIVAASKAGATLSTHLGNGVALMLPRHPNLLWEQLACDSLYASIIADGFHLPDAFLKVVIKSKGEKVILISDVTFFSGMAPGEYQTHIGEEVVLHKDGKLALKGSSSLLAGATKTLLEDIGYLFAQDIASLGKAWAMGSLNAAIFLGNKAYGLYEGLQADVVVFRAERKDLQIHQVIKNGLVVYENKTPEEIFRA